MSFDNVFYDLVEMRQWAGGRFLRGSCGSSTRSSAVPEDAMSPGMAEPKMAAIEAERAARRWIMVGGALERTWLQ